MTMKKRNRLRSARPKALFGAIASIIGSGINAISNYEQSKQQANAIRENARMQADALKLQNENANKLQEEMIAFTKEQNDLQRQEMRNIALQSQFQAGNQNTIAMQDANKLRFKNGGSTKRRRLRDELGLNSNNLPFTITDGGGVIPIGVTPEGYDLYEIIGNDHEHRHQVKTGASYKSGVGIKFADGKTIEGEGNQNTNQGEYMLVTPNDAKFISKHTIRGINPVELVNAGMHPLQAFNIQERIKDTYNIPDSGRYAKIGRSLKKCGGRKKAIGGGGLDLLYGNYVPSRRDFKNYFLPSYNTLIPIDNHLMTPRGVGKITSSLTIPDSSLKPTTLTNTDFGMSINPSFRSGWYSSLNDTAKGNLWGAGFNALGNIGGALISNIGNNAASSRLQEGYDAASGILTDAYSRLSGVNMNLIDKSMYAPAYAMAALQAPIVNSGAQRTSAERSLHRNLSRINRNTASSAALLNRSAIASSNYNDILGKINEGDERIRQSISQGNMDRVTNVSNENANRFAQARQEFGRNYLAMLQYNNDIANEAITGAAQARADAALNKASTIAGTRQANAASWAGAIGSSLSGFGNTLATNAKMAHELEMSKYGWTPENLYNWYINNPNDSGFNNFMNTYKNADGTYKDWYKELYKLKYGSYPS